MSGIKMDQDELPEYVVRSTIAKLITTADGTGQIEILAPGHHPKCRVLDAEVGCFDPDVSVQMQGVLELGDGTDIYTALNSGTADGNVARGAKASTDNIVERHEGLYYNVSAAGTDAVVLLLVQIESVD